MEVVSEEIIEVVLSTSLNVYGDYEKYLGVVVFFFFFLVSVK